MSYICNCVKAAYGQKTIAADQNNHRNPVTTKNSIWEVVEIQISLSNIHIALSEAIVDRVTAGLSTTADTDLHVITSTN